MRVKHIGFDLDGTLLDTREQIIRSLLACIEPQKRAAAKQTVLRLAGSSPKVILRQFGISRLDEYWRHHAKLASCARLFFDDTASTLEKIRAQGVTLSIITSLPSQPANALLKQAHIARFFSLVDTFASRPYRKPSPHLIRLHLNDLGVPPAEAAYVGDSEGDIQMARAAGVTALGAGWGPSGSEALSKVGAEQVLSSLAELADYSLM